MKYNCELSDGTFQNNTCNCSRGEDQTQEAEYDAQTGFCHSDISGPAGNAFQALIGLPYGEYDYHQNIIVDLYKSSGGSLSGAACKCTSGKNI